MCFLMWMRDRLGLLLEGLDRLAGLMILVDCFELPGPFEDDEMRS